MRHSLPITPQFYVTAPQPCPYLPDQQERKLFTGLQGSQSAHLHDSLSQQGFRRSQNVLYRPSCPNCNACLSARIVGTAFSKSKSQRRAYNRNKHLRREALSPWATEEQFALFQKYLNARHMDGGMADMNIFEFAAMIEETPINTRVVEYWDDRSGRPELRAVCLTDVLSDGVSMVYSFYDPDYAHLSIGTYLILDHIELARDMQLAYTYLGYWVPGSSKMGYKANFKPLEVFRNGDWELMTNETHYPFEHLSTQPADPIADQVSKIVMPDRHLF